MRFNKFGEETKSSQYCRELWESDDVSDEEKEWIEKIATKRNLKFSEERMIESIYERVFGKKKSYPWPDYCG